MRTRPSRWCCKTLQSQEDVRGFVVACFLTVLDHRLVNPVDAPADETNQRSILLIRNDRNVGEAICSYTTMWTLS